MGRSTFKITYNKVTARFNWKLVSPNGRNVCSGQSYGYKTKQSAIKGIRAVVNTAVKARVIDYTGPKGKRAIGL